MKLTQRLSLITAILLALILTSSCSAPEKKDIPTTSKPDDTSAATDYTPLYKDAVVVKKEALRDVVQASGTIQGHQEAILRTRSPGIIRSINFELGQSIAQNAVLLTLDDSIQNLSRKQLEQQYQTSLIDLRSKRDLFSRGNLAQNTLNQAEAATSALETQIATLERDISNTRVLNPIRGYIAEKSPGLIIGEQVAANQQIGRIIDLSRLKVTIAIGQRQVFLVQPGQKAEVLIATAAKTLEATGIVTAISAGSDARTGSWTVIIDFANPAPDILRAGMSAEILIRNTDAPKALIIPDQSLVKRDGKTWVFALVDDVPTLLEVRVLDQAGSRIAVETVNQEQNLEGLRVLTAGLSRAGKE